MSDLRPPVNLKIATMVDLARMLATWSQRDHPASLIHFENEGKHIYGTLLSHHGYYEMYGLPLWIYVETDEAPAGSFLSYKSRPKEEIRFVETIESEPMVLHFPLVNLSEKLSILDL
ncbi:MAG: hypothetical protein K9W43_05075 [Candidatus Thorarchaeota archaeon]|nr:hypothetical protein [Candidatus Thorarchaeota archaeon]